MTEVHPRIAEGNYLDTLLSWPVKVGEDTQKLTVEQIYDRKLVDLALSQGMDINAFDKYGWTLLYFACNDSDIEMAKYLISRGANPNVNCRLDNGKRAAFPCWRLLHNTGKTLKNFDEFVELFSETIKSDKNTSNCSVYDYLEYDRKNGYFP
jgi:hypothetical protein